MKHLLLVLIALACPAIALAETSNPVIRDVVSEHILPRFETLAMNSRELSDAADADCSPDSKPLRAAYAEAFDAWVSASHLRFGPTETGDRAFALAFWPDNRGKTPRALKTLIEDQDPVAFTAQGYEQVSIAARGFYALEFMLYDASFAAIGEAEYRCVLLRTISADIASTTASIHDDWQVGYAATMLSPGPDGPYRTDAEVLQEAFKALSTGLQFTSDTRLGRPLGSFERPRPKRAEARRSGRSAHHVKLSLVSLRDLARRLAATDPGLASRLDKQFDRALSRLSKLNDPVFAGVATPQGRIRVEVVQQYVDDIRTLAQTELGPLLGVSAGFNALDGD